MSNNKVLDFELQLTPPDSRITDPDELAILDDHALIEDYERACGLHPDDRSGNGMRSLFRGCLKLAAIEKTTEFDNRTSQEYADLLKVDKRTWKRWRAGARKWQTKDKTNREDLFVSFTKRSMDKADYLEDPTRDSEFWNTGCDLSITKTVKQLAACRKRYHELWTKASHETTSGTVSPRREQRLRIDAIREVVGEIKAPLLPDKPATAKPITLSKLTKDFTALDVGMVVEKEIRKSKGDRVKVLETLLAAREQILIKLQEVNSAIEELRSRMVTPDRDVEPDHPTTKSAANGASGAAGR
ncbi:MAG: hypothetical protein L0220_02825 [Acidobacteria bacterium]|nr:hypothetical protein [Acidobacteriota bacterium]